MHRVLKCFRGLFLVLLLLASPALGQDPSEITHPKGDKTAPPVWVSAEAATSSAGTIDWGILGENAYEIYQSVVRNTPRLVVESPGEAPKYDPDSSGLRPECVYYGAAHFDYANAPASETLDDVLKNAQAVLRGRITKTTFGFYQGEPNTLLTVSLERKARSSRAFPETNRFYVVYPKAKFSIGDVDFCKHDSKFPYSPKVGDRVLLLPLHGPQGEGARLIQPGPGEIIFEAKNGGLVIPQKFNSAAAGRRLEKLEDIEDRLPGSK